MTGAQLGLWYFTTMCLASCVRRVKKELPGVFDIIHRESRGKVHNAYTSCNGIKLDQSLFAPDFLII